MYSGSENVKRPAKNEKAAKVRETQNENENLLYHDSPRLLTENTHFVT